MTKEEFRQCTAEQLKIKHEAEAEMQRIRQEYIDSADIKVGDVVNEAKPKGSILNPSYEVGEEVRVVKMGIDLITDEIGVVFVNRKTKKGEFSQRSEYPHGGVLKDGKWYPRVWS